MLATSSFDILSIEAISTGFEKALANSNTIELDFFSFKILIANFYLQLYLLVLM